MNKAQSMIERIDVLSKAEKCKECGCKMTKMGCSKMGCGGNKMAKGDSTVGTFTIGDASKRNAGEYAEDKKREDYSQESGEDYARTFREFDEAEANEKPAPMREDSAPARTLPLSEGKPREQKRGDASRGVQVKKPGFRSKEQMPLSDDSPRVKESQMAKSESGAQPGFNTSFDTKPQDIAFVSESGGQTRNAYYTTNQHLLDSDDVANKGATSVSVSLEKLASMLNPHEGGGASRLDDGGVLKNNPN
jgi:hypothetical protein